MKVLHHTALASFQCYACFQHWLWIKKSHTVLQTVNAAAHSLPREEARTVSSTGRRALSIVNLFKQEVYYLVSYAPFWQQWRFLNSTDVAAMTQGEQVMATAGSPDLMVSEGFLNIATLWASYLSPAIIHLPALRRWLPAQTSQTPSWRLDSFN